MEKAFYSFFAVTDESFAVAALRKEKLTTGYMIGLGSIGYVSWVLECGRAFCRAAMPAVLQESMSIALYAMFIGLLVPPLKNSEKSCCWRGGCAIQYRFPNERNIVGRMVDRLRYAFIRRPD